MSVRNLLFNSISCSREHKTDPIRAFCGAALAGSVNRLHIDNASAEVRACLETLEAELETWAQQGIEPWSTEITAKSGEINSALKLLKSLVPQEDDLDGVFDWGDIYRIEDLCDEIDQREANNIDSSKLFKEIEITLLRMLETANAKPGADSLVKVAARN